MGPSSKILCGEIPMNLRTQKTVLYVSAAGTVVGAVIVAALALAMPLGGESGVNLRVVEHREIAPSSRPARVESLFAGALDCELRRPLVDVATTTPVALAVAPVVRPGLQLLGTVVEPGHSMAYIATAGEKPTFKSLGAVVGGMTIVDIAEGAITLESDGHRQVIVVPRPAKTTTGSPPAVRRGPAGDGRDR
jgi:hypothetical protein